MHNIKLTIEYDGTNYVGWQVQPNGISVQQVVEEALAKLVREPVRLRSSGRTDAGVHARGMIASFRTEKLLPMSAYSDGLNSLLPPDIAVREAAEASPDFHPRIDAVGKHYRYTILTAPRRSPLARLFVWQLRCDLNVGAMREAARHFVGEKDFASFRGARCNAKTTVRRIDSVEIHRDESFVIIDVKGSGFLKNMVRIMAGTLVEVGKGILAPDDIIGMLEGGSRELAGITAPPQGLCLIEVFY